MSEARESIRTPWLTGEGLAAYLSVAIGTVRNWTSNGFVPHVKRGRTVRYHRDTIDAWLSSGNTQAEDGTVDAESEVAGPGDTQAEVASMTVDIGPFEVNVYKAPTDGVYVFEIGTANLNEDVDGPICRVYLNDAVLHENPVYPEKVDAG